MKQKNSAVWEAVLSIDLEPIRERLHGRGAVEMGWVAFGKRDYRLFLYLLATHPTETIVPTKLIDLFWHEHILDTRKYAADCKSVLGSLRGRKFIHHDPSVLPGSARFAQGIEARNRLFEEYSGGPPMSISKDDGVACDGESCA